MKYRPLILLLIAVTVALAVAPLPILLGEDEAEDPPKKVAELKVTEQYSLGGKGNEDALALSADGRGGFWMIMLTNSAFSVGKSVVKASKTMERYVGRFDVEKRWEWAENLKTRYRDDFQKFDVAATADFGWIGGVYPKNLKDEKSGDNAFITRMGNDNVVKVKQEFGGPVNDIFCALCLDGGTGVWVACEIKGPTKIGELKVKQGETRSLVIHFDAEAKVLACAEISSDGSLHISDMCLAPDGGVWVTGVYTGAAGFGKELLTGGTSNQAFLARCDSAGKWQLVRSAQGGETLGIKVCPDGKGGCWLTGTIAGSSKFCQIELDAANQVDTYVARIAPNGNCEAANTLPGLLINNVAGICAMGPDSCWVLVNTYAGESIRNPQYRKETLIALVDAQCNIIGQHKLTDNHTYGGDICCDAAGGCWVTGNYQEVMTYNNVSLIPRGGTEIFVLRVAPPK
ncbi:MAG: hypothetical protein WC712_07260 [Candidatus Brocadiia bacterium]